MKQNTNMSRTLKNYLASPLPFFSAILIILLFNIHESPGFYDSPEYVISFLDGSLVHPSSYPLYYILMKALTLFLPGSVLFRMHLVNSLFSFSALIFFYLILRKKGIDKILSYLGVLLLLLGDYFLHYTFNFEVYSLYFLFTALFFYIYQFALLRKEYFPLLTFIFSMGLVVHPLFLFFGQFLLKAFIIRKPSVLKVVIPMILPFLSYLSLMALALRQPLFNWENATDFTALFRIIFRRGFSHITMMLNPGGILVSGPNILKNSLIIFLLLPFLKNIKKNLFELFWCIAYIIFISFFFFNVQAGWFDWAIYFFPVYLLMTEISLANISRSRIRYIITAAAVAVLLILNFSFLPFGKYPYPQAYMNDLLSCVQKEKAMIFTNDDSTAYLLNLNFLFQRERIPIVLSLWPYQWYRDSLEKYSGLDLASASNEAAKAFVSLKKRYPEIGFYITRGCEKYFNDYYKEEIPPYLITELELNRFRPIHLKRLTLLECKKKPILEVENIFDAYSAFLKNAAVYYIRKKEFSSAREVLGSVHMMDAEMACLSAEAFAGDGKLLSSSKVLLECISEFPDFKPAYHLLMGALVELGRQDAAEHLLLEYQRAFPADIKGSNALSKPFKKSRK